MLLPAAIEIKEVTNSALTCPAITYESRLHGINLSGHYYCVEKRTPTPGLHPSAPHWNELNLTLVKKKSSVHPLKASYLPGLVRGKFLSGSLGVWLRRDGFVAVRCCLAVPSCSPAPSLSCALHRLLFRDVLIKQHVEPESRTAAETRTVTQCLSAPGERRLPRRQHGSIGELC